MCSANDDLSPISVAHLPDDDLLHIFSYVNLIDAGRIPRVCHRWYTVSADHSWLPTTILFSLGAGKQVHACRPEQKSLSAPAVIQVICCNHATLFLLEDGRVFQKPSWSNGQVQVLSDIALIACSPPGYHHHDGYRGSIFLAVSRQGQLYSWGIGNSNKYCELMRRTPTIEAMTKPDKTDIPWTVMLAACGRHFSAVHGVKDGIRFTMTVGRFNKERPHRDCFYDELRGKTLLSLSCGAFFCCALTSTNELWVWGDNVGKDISNGNLLGYYDIKEPICTKPFVMMYGVMKVSCSTYSVLAITYGGHVVTWGDSDGHCLAHQDPFPQSVTVLYPRMGWSDSGSTCYPLCATACANRSLWMWGGTKWIRSLLCESSEPKCIVERFPIPPCYKTSDVTLALDRLFVIFRKQING